MIAVAFLAGLARLIPAAARAAGTAARSGRGGRVGGGMGGGGSGGGVDTERAKEFALAIGKATTAVLGLVVSWTKLSAMLLESRRHFSQFNATTAIAFANLDRQRTLRTFGTAGFTSESTRGLAESINRFETTIQPLKAGVMDGMNRLATVGVDLITSVVSLAERIPILGGKIDDWRKELERASREGNAAQFAGLNYLAEQSPWGQFSRNQLPDL